MNRIERTFKELKARRKAAFIAFVTAGYPDLAATEKLIAEFGRAGVDIIELGIPFSDPLADGPLIQNASVEAIRNGATMEKIIAMVKRARRSTDIPICFMTYYNPVFVMGEKRFIAACRDAGVDGVIIPDLPVEEGKKFSAAARRSGLDTVFFVSPTTADSRLRPISAASRGFIYYVSLAGVTGPRARLPRELKNQVTRLKAFTDKPVCVGFGISSPAQVKEVGAFADGVIVGSAIVRKIKENIGNPRMVSAVAGFTARLAGKPSRR